MTYLPIAAVLFALLTVFLAISQVVNYVSLLHHGLLPERSRAHEEGLQQFVLFTLVVCFCAVVIVLSEGLN